MIAEHPRRLYWLILGAILGLSFSLTFQASKEEAAIMDELAHIPAGYSYLRYLDYRLNPEHPPLLKVLAALPLLGLKLNFPTSENAWQNDINGQWTVGNQFLYHSGNDADQILRWVRIGPMVLTLILIFFVYLWSRELMGPKWALLPVFVLAFSPHILAHAHYVTTDVAAAMGVVLATYFFLKFLHHPSKKNLIYAALAFGTAQLAKFSAAILFPYFLLLLTAFYCAGVWTNWRDTIPGKRWRRFGSRALRYLRALAIICVVGYLAVVYPVYTLLTVNYPAAKQTADTEFILTSFAGGPTPPDSICKPARCLAELDIWMTKNPITRPLAEYLLGLLMVLQRSAGGNTAYFRGEVSAAGSHLYFPVVYLLKEPLPILVFVFTALFLGIKGIFKAIRRYPRRARLAGFMDYLNVNFPEFSMIVFVILYWGWSIQSPLNIGFRHLFPALPFTYILAATAWKKWIVSYEWRAMFLSFPGFLINLKNAFHNTLKYILLFILLGWLLAETLLAAPYFLSYFNQFGGGVYGGYRYVTDSNYDWGQDLRRLKEFVATHPEINKIAVDYFGGGDTAYYLGNKVENWWSARGNPADQGIKWLAVSINTLQGATQPAAPGFERRPEDEYRWLTELRPPPPGMGQAPPPDYRAGTSIFIYRL